MSGGSLRKYFRILFKTRFGVFSSVTSWRVVVFCVFNKKRKVFEAEENSGLHKRELLKYYESFPILVWGESVNRNSIVMISKGYHHVINQWYFQGPEQNKQSFCMTIFRRDEDGAQPIICYMVFLIMLDRNFFCFELLCFGFCKICAISLIQFDLFPCN